MSQESLPKLTRAPALAQTHTLHLDDRFAKGKALRDLVSRKLQGEWTPPADRADPVDILVENSADRIKELLPIR
jgi:hypothetical protein